jgi:hypothetical protein
MTWEPLRNVIIAHVALREYEKRFEGKPKPTKQEVKAARLQAVQDVEGSDVT